MATAPKQFAPEARETPTAANDAAPVHATATRRAPRVTMRLPSGDVPLFHARRA